MVVSCSWSRRLNGPSRGGCCREALDRSSGRCPVVGQPGRAPLMCPASSSRRNRTHRATPTITVLTSEDVDPPVQHVVAVQRHLPEGEAEVPHHTIRRLLRRHDRDLRRHETGRQPGAHDRPLLYRFTRDERLQDGPSTSAREVTITTFLDRPHASDDGPHDVGRARDSFFRDDNPSLSRARRREPCEQPLPRDRILHKVEVTVNVKSTLTAADLPPSPRLPRDLGRRHHAPPSSERRRWR